MKNINEGFLERARYMSVKACYNNKSIMKRIFAAITQHIKLIQRRRMWNGTRKKSPSSHQPQIIRPRKAGSIGLQVARSVFPPGSEVSPDPRQRARVSKLQCHSSRLRRLRRAALASSTWRGHRGRHRAHAPTLQPVRVWPLPPQWWHVSRIKSTLSPGFLHKQRRKRQRGEPVGSLRFLGNKARCLWVHYKLFEFIKRE